MGPLEKTVRTMDDGSESIRDSSIRISKVTTIKRETCKLYVTAKRHGFQSRIDYNKEVLKQTKDPKTGEAFRAISKYITHRRKLVYHESHQKHPSKKQLAFERRIITEGERNHTPEEYEEPHLRKERNGYVNWLFSHLNENESTIIIRHYGLYGSSPEKVAPNSEKDRSRERKRKANKKGSTKKNET